MFPLNIGDEKAIDIIGFILKNNPSIRVTVSYGSGKDKVTELIDTLDQLPLKVANISIDAISLDMTVLQPGDKVLSIETQKFGVINKTEARTANVSFSDGTVADCYWNTLVKFPESIMGVDLGVDEPEMKTVFIKEDADEAYEPPMPTAIY